MQAICAGCCHLQHLNLHECKQITDAGLHAIGERCGHLQQLSLLNCQLITYAGSEFIRFGCSQLRKLTTSHFVVEINQTTNTALVKVDAGLEDNDLIVLIACCPDVLHLDLQNCDKIQDVGLQASGAGCC